MILAALGITDELLRAPEERAGQREDVRARLHASMTLLDQALPPDDA